MNASGVAAARLTGVTHRYGATLALDHVDLTLARGRLVGFVGPDGVGKSCLLALMAGARRIQEGRVEALGADLALPRARARVCRRIAYMPQGLGRNLYPTLSSHQNLEFFGRLFGERRTERRERIAALLEATGLAPFRDRPVAQLSGGMKQKLGLCCALVHEPDLLILDEPTTGVDPLSRRQFWRLLDRLRADRPDMTLAISTAYFQEAEAFEELVVMDGGRVLAHATPDEVKARTGAADLEAAFVSMLPAPRRAGYGEHARDTPARATQGEIAIEADALTRRFGDFTAVDRVSFRIPRGEIFGFIGSNGCGKTTTMKMLTGLLPATAGNASIFGRAADAHDLDTRRRVGFMSQSFSLYTELTVRQNLALHARLFHLPSSQVAARIDTLVERFGLGDYLGQVTEAVPLGVRQRLSLAVAVIHEPDVLILDEPTSGVDPVARDRFWALLSDLARERGVTIFVSTHFMHEAQRCDRIALMHDGRVLAQGAPAEVVRASGAQNLEDAFIRVLSRGAPAAGPPVLPHPVERRRRIPDRRFSTARMVAHARREAMELLRDRVRLAFVFLGPVILMLVFGLGITFDLEDVAYAAYDHDRTPESRAYLENFSASRYFEQHASPDAPADLERRLRNGELRFAIEVPAGFGRALARGREPEVSIQVDGAFPFRGQTTQAYVEAAHASYLVGRAREAGRTPSTGPAQLETRLRYNQEFRSVYAVVPSVMMVILMLIPAVTTAMGVVREKELGSITNLYVTPTTGLEFLLGKQLPYVVVALINFATLTAVAVLFFHVPLKGSGVGLATAAMLYVAAATAFGLVVSSFVRTQIAALFAAGILASLPTVQYSGFMLPVSSMSLDAQLIGRLFPSMYFEHAAVGTFTKALPFAAIVGDLAAMAAILVALVAVARALLRTQEA